MEQLLLESPKVSHSNIPESLRHLFSIENPLEFSKETINLTKNLTIDENKKKATLEFKKELRYQILTIEMDEEERLTYIMKKGFKKAGVKLVYDLKPVTQLFVSSITPDKNFERPEPIKPLTLSSVEPPIPVPSFLESLNDFAYMKNIDYSIIPEDEYLPSYQEELNPLKYNQELIELNNNPEIPFVTNEMVHRIEVPKIDPDLQVIDYRMGYQIENYDTPLNLTDHKVYQKISLDNHSIIPGTSAYHSLINAGLDIETSYHNKWGIMMNGVNGIKNDDQRYWGLFVNGVAPNVAIDKIKIKPTDEEELVYTEMSKGSSFAGRNITDYQ
jgi:hypothetical protein